MTARLFQSGETGRGNGRRALARWAGVVLLEALLAGCTGRPSWVARADSDDLPQVEVGRDTLIDSTVALGTFKPKVGAEIKVGSQLSGVVADLKVSVGDEVKRGEVLATLHRDEWQARVDTLKAELASAIAEKEYAEGELERDGRLQGLVPALQIDAATRDLSVKTAAVARAKSSLKEAEIQLGYTVIRAPLSGTISSVSTYRGETVAASLAAPTFVTIVDLKRLEIQAYVDETDIGRIRVGQPVTVRVDAYPGHELAGAVRAIHPKAQLVNNVVDYIVIVDLKNPEALVIRPEMTAHVTFVLAEKEDVVNIPRSALVREKGRTFVVVKSAGGWLERAVTIALQTRDRVEIRSGLSAGEIIVADKQAWKDHADKRQP